MNKINDLIFMLRYDEVGMIDMEVHLLNIVRKIFSI